MTDLIHRLYRRFRFGAPIVVVSGLPRSGTSMAMKMLEAGGLSTIVDGVRTADEDNPKGYFEDERVKDLATAEDKSWLRDARGKGVKIIAYLLTHLPQENNYKVIFMERNIEEVLRSQQKMLERRGEDSATSDEQMVELYGQNLEKVRFVLRYRDCFETLYVNYGQAIENPRAMAQRLTEFLGLPLDVDGMAAVVDESLYRNRAEPSPSGSQ